MPLDFTAALSESRQLFTEFVKTPLEKILDGKIFPVEGDPNPVLESLDKKSGIDAILIKEFGLYGIALRIQMGPLYRTFTVRKQRASHAKTEYEKLTLAAEKQALTPRFTAQAYIDPNARQLLGGAVMHTCNLLDLIQSNRCKTKHTHNDQIGQAEFFVVDWDTVKNQKLWIQEFVPTNIAV